jgi:tetratricopeptide (TPR) repeat protein
VIPNVCPISRGFRHALIALMLLYVGSACRVPAKEQIVFDFSDTVIEELKKLEALQQNKNWEGAIKLIDRLYTDVPNDSYDAAMLLLFKGKVSIIIGDNASAIKPLEDALRLATAKQYFKPEVEADLRLYVMQAYYSMAIAKGISLADQRASYLKALENLEARLGFNLKENQEITLMHIQVLFGLASCNLGANKTDMSYINKAQRLVEDALSNTTKPKEVLYAYLVNCLQMKEDLPKLAEYLELSCKLNPGNKQSWALLYNVYSQLGQGSNPEVMAENFTRAIITLDRAQALGNLNTPNYNYNRVILHFNLQQHELATDYLYKGLMNGGIEDTPKNWELLARSLQQINRDADAISTLREAIRRYPELGTFWFMIAQSYYNMDKVPESYEASQKAINVGRLDKPSLTYSFAATMAFQLRLFDEGLVLVEKAMTFPDSKRDAQISKLKLILEDSIKARALNKQAVDAQHRNL